jgi:hypothetical protein
MQFGVNRRASIVIIALDQEVSLAAFFGKLGFSAG